MSTEDDENIKKIHKIISDARKMRFIEILYTNLSIERVGCMFIYVYVKALCSLYFELLRERSNVYFGSDPSDFLLFKDQKKK